mgnify:CR=1 FL=1
MGVKYLAVDLSEYQRGISFPRLKAEGVQGVILRGGDGSYYDKCFETFYAQAKANGLPVGSYWFSRAKTVADAEAEAERFYDRCLAGKTFELPIYLDCEADSQLRIGKRALTDVVKAWSAWLVAKGYLCGVYSTANWFRNCMHFDELADLEIWVAQWSRRAPNICYGMWQFGGETNLLRDKHIAGYVVDQNYMVVDYATITKNGGFNGFEAPKHDEEEEEMTRYHTFDEVPDWAKPEIKELMDAGALRGDEKGDLNLSDDLMRAIIINKRYTESRGCCKGM